MESLVSDALFLMTGAVGQTGRYTTEPLGEILSRHTGESRYPGPA
jgi:hypothetical protein